MGEHVVMDGSEIAFVAFGLVWQAALLAFFVARRWRPALTDGLGVVAYSIGGLGLPLAAWLVLAEPPFWRLAIGPFLAAGWALLGWWVDLHRPRPWRGPPIRWNVLVPYVGLYFWAQMFLWWPLWDIERAAWVAFLVLFVGNTTLNLVGHRRSATARQGSTGPVRTDRR
jgi:hypothetical protein